MSTLKQFRSSLEQLAATTPNKKTAIIRSLLPAIEAALHSGQTLKQIWHTLEEQGLVMGYHVFQVTLWRVRKKKATAAPSRREKDWPTELQSLQGSEMQKPEERDPLVNLRRLEANRPGFHWQATKTSR